LKRFSRDARYDSRADESRMNGRLGLISCSRRIPKFFCARRSLLPQTLSSPLDKSNLTVAAAGIESVMVHGG